MSKLRPFTVAISIPCIRLVYIVKRDTLWSNYDRQKTERVPRPRRRHVLTTNVVYQSLEWSVSSNGNNLALLELSFNNNYFRVKLDILIHKNVVMSVLGNPHSHNLYFIRIFTNRERISVFSQYPRDFQPFYIILLSNVMYDFI